MARRTAEKARRFTKVGYLDLPGGGQVVVRGHLAFVGHMRPPHGTSILDVADPARPRLLSQVTVPEDVHSHKVRVVGEFMLVNYERYPPTDTTRSPQVGLKIFDIGDPSRPREAAFFPTHGRGVHRFDIQGPYAYVSTEWVGFRSNILAILDVSNPLHPSVVGRWSLPGQEASEGEASSRQPTHYWVHLALARGNRVYAACGRAGVAIVDVSDPRQPATVGTAQWNPPYTSPTHTFLPIPHPIRNRRFAVVTDEDVTDEVLEDPPSFMWVLDITHEARPVPVATYHATPRGLVAPGKRFGAHQPWEHVRDDNIVFVTWFSGGVRAVDISDPYAPSEVGYYVPPRDDVDRVPQTNDVYVDERGLVYTIDRSRGFHVLAFGR